MTFKADLYCVDCKETTEHEIGERTICLKCEKKKTIVELIGIERAKESLDKIIEQGDEFFAQMKKEYPDKYFQIACYIDELLCNYPDGKIPKDIAEKLAKKHDVYDIYLKELYRLLIEKEFEIKSFSVGG